MESALKKIIGKLLAIILIELCIMIGLYFSNFFPGSTPLHLFMLRGGLSLITAASMWTIIFGSGPVGFSRPIIAGMGAVYALAILSLFYISSPTSLGRTSGSNLSESERQETLAPAGPEEKLIVIAEFQDRGQGWKISRIDPTAILYESVVEAAQGSTVRVTRHPGVTATGEEARRIGDQYQGSLVVWGWFDDLDVQPMIEPGSRLGLNAPADIDTPIQMESFPLADASARAAYLAQLWLGMAHVNLASSDELQEALRYFNAAVAMNNDWEALMWRANCYTWLGGHEFALKDYDRAVAINPGSESGYNNRGVVYARLGDDQSAIEDYTQALAIDPGFAGAYVNRAQSLARQGNLTDAITDYTRAIDLDPNDAPAYVGRGNVHAVLQDYQAAINDYTQALTAKPDGLSYVHRGNAHAALQDYQAAIDDYTQSLDLNPRVALTYVNRGSAYAALQNYQAAVENYTQALALNPKDELAYMHRANSYIVLQDYQAAIDDYSRALTLNPEDSLAYVNRGNAYAAVQDYQSALEDYNQAVVLDPDSGLAYMHRGNTQVVLQDFQAAVDDYTRALALNPTDASAYVSRGHTYGALLDYESAIDDYSQAIAINPADASVYVSRGNAHGALLDYESAIDDYSQAISVSPDYVLAYANRGAAYKEQWHLGQPTREKAIADFERVLALVSDPDWQQIIKESLQELVVTE